VRISVWNYQVIADDVPDKEDPRSRHSVVDSRSAGWALRDILFRIQTRFSPSAIGFDIQAFAEEQGGIATNTELTRGTTRASDIVMEPALGHSINPRLLLTLVEFESGWSPECRKRMRRIVRVDQDRSRGSTQTGLLIRQLSQGYYGWRAGTLDTITFLDGSSLRLSPILNAGTVGVMYALAQYHDRASWEAALYGSGNCRNPSELFGALNF
jgi:hypothetical protein